ncbi:MAG: hypothetical protein J6I36_10395, partial [Bacteroidaceae bacterium]|nr:hypothetical protein [Bacteroidaceae bacterium]
LVGQSFKERFRLSQNGLLGTVLSLSRRPLSRLRVQRYGDFLKPPNLFDTFLQKICKKVDKGQARGKRSRAYLLYIIREGI